MRVPESYTQSRRSWFVFMVHGVCLILKKDSNRDYRRYRRLSRLKFWVVSTFTHGPWPTYGLNFEVQRSTRLNESQKLFLWRVYLHRDISWRLGSHLCFLKERRLEGEQSIRTTHHKIPNIHSYMSGLLFFLFNLSADCFVFCIWPTMNSMPEECLCCVERQSPRNLYTSIHLYLRVDTPVFSMVPPPLFLRPVRRKRTWSVPRRWVWCWEAQACMSLQRKAG